MIRHIHIVSLDVPFPPDYGGAIDIFYKIEALYKAGIKIHLHYFSYNHRGNPNELNQYCESIHVYERITGHKGFSFRLPYIVASRIQQELVDNLNKDDHPILLEGIHTTGILPAINKSGRKIVVRLHNDESEYYKQLANSSNSLFRKIYFLNESRLLKKYERQLPPDGNYACITTSDAKMFSDLGLKESFFLPAFIPFRDVNGQEGIGNFCLYHGNLSVPENEKAACWLLNRVFPDIQIPLVLAGKNPSKKLEQMAHRARHTCLVANPSSAEINDLVQKAHINILPSFSTTGIKIKLLHALFEGRHLVTNPAMVEGTGLESAAHIASTDKAMAAIIVQLHHQPYTREEILLRRRITGDTYNNEKNASKLIQYLW